MQNSFIKPSWGRFVAVGLVACTLVACGGGSNAITEPNPTSSVASIAASSTPKSSTPASSSASSTVPALIGNLTQGKALYESTCMSCHKADGSGNIGPAINTGATTFERNGMSHTLAHYISEFMPKSKPGSCTGQCAADVAAYVANGFSVISPIVAKVGYTLQQIDNCGVTETPSANSYIIYDNTVNNIVGWNSASMFATSLSLAPAAYNVPGNIAEDSTCNKQKTQSLIMIKKYADWDKQHANGIKSFVSAGNITFGNADKIVIELKLNSAHSKILDKTALKAIYKNVLTDIQYDQLDQAKAVFSFFLLNAVDSGTGQVKTQRFIEIDPALYNDKWVRVTISVADMDLYTGDDWERTKTTAELQANTKVANLMINPEVYGSRADDHWKWGNVIRNFIPNTFVDLKLPETFKEMDITVKKIEVIRK